VTQSSFTDDGSRKLSTQTLPFQFYPGGSASNLYSAFLHRNSTLDPAEGVSVNGLAYGYPFGDQAGLSSNIGYLKPPGALTISIGNFSPPALAFTTPDAVLPNAGIGANYEEKLTTNSASGGLTFSVVAGSLPGWLSLDSQTGTLTGTPKAGDAGPVSFSVQVTDGQGNSASSRTASASSRPRS
jgi:hypothetical protein